MIQVFDAIVVIVSFALDVAYRYENRHKHSEGNGMSASPYRSNR